MIKSKKTLCEILVAIIIVVVVVGVSFYVGKLTTTPVPEEKPQEEYYGTSTYGPCRADDDCYISGCNSEICQSKGEEPLYSICILPPKPTPLQLSYECKCINLKCRWSK